MFYCIDYLHILSVLWSSETRCKMNIFIKVRFFITTKKDGSTGPTALKVMGHILKSWDNDPGPP